VIANVTTLVVRAGVPAGTEGKVVGMTEDRNGLFVDVGNEEAVEYQLGEVQASHGEVERTRMEYGTDYAGTGLPEELLQITGQLKTMIDAGWSYLFMEKYLMSMSFNFSMIRKAFETLTGIKAEDVVNFDYLESPGCIPAFSLGWGENKKGGGYRFVMPMMTWYGCFNQTDDMTRVEVCRHDSIKEAIECLGKNVKKVMRWDPPVKENKHQLYDTTQMKNQPQIFMHASTRQIAAEVMQLPAGERRKEWIDEAYLAARIDKQAHQDLLRVFCDAKEAAEKEIVKDTVDRAHREPMPEVGATEPDAQLPVQVAQAVAEYIEKRNEELRGFHLTPGNYTYKKLPSSKGVSMDSLGQDKTGADIVIKMELEVTSKRDENERRRGWTILYIVQGQLNPSDNIKDLRHADIEPKGLTDEGLETFFSETAGLIGEESTKLQ